MLVKSLPVYSTFFLALILVCKGQASTCHHYVDTPSTWNQLTLMLRFLPWNNLSSFYKLLKSFVFIHNWTEIDWDWVAYLKDFCTGLESMLEARHRHIGADTKEGNQNDKSTGRIDIGNCGRWWCIGESIPFNRRVVSSNPALATM